MHHFCRRLISIAGTIAVCLATMCEARTADTDDQRWQRLAAAAKLWAEIEYFHPWLSYRDDIDWDAAFVSAAPEIVISVVPDDRRYSGWTRRSPGAGDQVRANREVESGHGTRVPHAAGGRAGLLVELQVAMQGRWPGGCDTIARCTNLRQDPPRLRGRMRP